MKGLLPRGVPALGLERFYGPDYFFTMDYPSTPFHNLAMQVPPVKPPVLPERYDPGRLYYSLPEVGWVGEALAGLFRAH